MGSTNKTAHYELPQFVANDKPSWLGDVNEAMEAIDTGIYGAKSSADGAQQTANNAVAGVASAGTRMDGIQTQLDTVATQANQTATTVTGHTSAIATNSANINTLNSRMGSTDISAIGDGTVTGAISAISGGGGGGSVTTKATYTTTASSTYGDVAGAFTSALADMTPDQKANSWLEFDYQGGNKQILPYISYYYVNIASVGTSGSAVDIYRPTDGKVFRNNLGGSSNSEITSTAFGASVVISLKVKE